MPQTHVLRDAYGWTPSAIIELITLDGTAIGMTSLYRFVNGSNTRFQPVTFNGIQYTPFPIEIRDMEAKGDGSLPRPKLSVSNINGFVSNLLIANGRSLDGATITRTRVPARFLDAANFETPTPTWVTPDVTATYTPEPFTIMRKIAENRQIVAWELASPLEAKNAKVGRQITANACAWKYRQSGTCNYTGAPISDSANRLFTAAPYSLTLVDAGEYDSTATYDRGDYVTLYSDIPQLSTIATVWVCLLDGTAGVTPNKQNSRNWAADVCTKSSAACKARFPTTPLRTSAFAGTARAPWISRQR